jgi:uncharacterized membrane protein YphA (DoxX/SURF4 family)
MNGFTKFFLILLRLAIGWHLLFAGLAKFQDDYKGSEGYLQGSGGPLAPMFQWMPGDRLADKLAADPDTNKSAADRFPPTLNDEWNDYIEAFAAHYGLDGDQRKDAQEKTDKIKEQAVTWMTTQKVVVKKTSPYGPPAEVEKTIPEWRKVYQEKRQAIRNESAGDYQWIAVPPSLADNTQDRAAARKEVADIRAELTKGLDGFKNEMKDALSAEVKPDQAAKGPFTEPVKPAWKHMTRMDWIDFAVRWGLTVSGACLILGFFTRLNCLAGALLLLSFYLAVPPLPGLPEAFRAEGYPYVNKNIVEMLALLTLATTRSGRWAGIDGLIYYLNPFRKKSAEPAQGGSGRVGAASPSDARTPALAR